MQKTAKYKHVKEHLVAKIKSNKIKAHDSIDSEQCLATNFNISRMTARKAVDELVNEGMLYRIKGSGTYVSDRKFAKNSEGFTCFTEDMISRGLNPTCKILSFELTEADMFLAEKLYIKEDDLVYKIKRLRSADNIPMSLETTYLPRDLVGKIKPENVNKSLFGFLENELNLEISYSLQEIEARICDQDVSCLLGVPEGAAVLRIVCNSFLANGNPFEYVESFYRADIYKFTQLVRRKSK